MAEEEALKLFISYSHKDEPLRDSLATHLSNLQWQGIISSWYDRQLTAGTEWDDKIKAELESADIILLLISPDFIASKYCREFEIPKALQRHESKQACVVPVILRPFDWVDAPFAKLQAFPKDAKAVTTWTNQDEAFVSVTQGIRTAAKLMLDYRKQQAEQKQVIRTQYLQKVEEVLSDGVISIVERDTLDELREALGLTSEEAKKIEARAYEPYSRYEESLNKYKQTLNRLIEKGYYPFSEEIEKDLENRQRDLGIKVEDVARISKPILDQAELDYQAKKKQQDEAQQLESLEQHQQREREEYEAKLGRYQQEFTKAIEAEYPLNQSVADGLKNFQQQLELKSPDIARIEQPIRERAEAKYREQQREVKPQPANMVSQQVEIETVKLRIEKTGILGLGQPKIITERSRQQIEIFTEALGNGVSLELVKIPAGEFLMGSPKTETGRSSDEGPQHRVKVPEFWLGRYAITQAQWRIVAALSKISQDLNPEPSFFKGDNRPVEQVSWHDAVEFCARLSKLTRRKYRLPSEAEWERACRAGTTTPFYFGETITTDLVNYDGNYTYKDAPKGIYREETTPVGQFSPNAFGLYDMHGNVWEWCADYWHGNYEGATTDGSAWITGSGQYRVIRGGSWLTNPAYCRAAYRHGHSPPNRRSLGFRVVCACFPGLF